jgi:preprotein translocase subunit SecE
MKKAKKPVNYLIESKNELLKVVWPDRKTTLNMTIAVIIVSVIVAFFLGVVDYVLLKVLGLILK